MTKKEILTFLRDKKEFLAQNYGVTSIGLFGSYARDEARKDSDIDIAIELKSENKFMNFFNLKYYLENNLHKRIDMNIGIYEVIVIASKAILRYAYQQQIQHEDLKCLEDRE